MRSEHIYYLFIALTEIGYGATMTLYTPYMVSLGIGYEGIALLNVTFQGTIVGLEVPTGVIADRYGRAASIAVGTFLLSLAGFCYTYAYDFWTIMVTEFLCGIGFCCISGALSAWVIDARDRVAEMRVLLSNGAGVRTASFLAGNVCAVYLAPHFGEQVGFSIMGLTVGAACLVAFTAMRPRDVVQPAKEGRQGEEIRLVLGRLKALPSLRWGLAMTALMGTMVNFNLYWVLFMRPRLSLPELGWMATLILISVGVASRIVRSDIGHRLKEGRGHLVAATIAASTLACFGEAQPTFMWATMLLFHEVGRGMYQLFHETFIHERVEERYRATFGSVASFVGACGCGLTLLITSAVFYGRHPDPSAIPPLWLGTSIVCLMGTAMLWRLRPR